MLIFEDFLVVGCILVWALLLGLIDLQDKLYVFIFAWVVLTWSIASHTAVKLICLIMAWALLFNIVMHLAQGLCRTVRNWLCSSHHRRAHVTAAAA